MRHRWELLCMQLQGRSGCCGMRGRKSRRRGCGTGDKHKQWLNNDVAGLVTGSITWAVALSGLYCLFQGVIIPWLGWSTWGIIHGTLFTLVTVLALLSHLRGMLSNPGAVPFDAKPTDPSFYAKQCYKCNNFKPPRAHHCSICNRCIVKMDHHCCWLNNCVGLANMKFFLLFLVYIFTMSLYGLGLVAARFFACMGSGGGANAVLAMHARARAAALAAGGAHAAAPAGALLVGGLQLPGLQVDAAAAAAAAAAASAPAGSGGVGRLLLEGGAAAVADAVAAAAAAADGAPGQQPPAPVLSSDPACDVTPGQMLAIIWSIIIAVLFAIFTGCLFGDQVSNILSGTTGIDRLKGHAPAAQDSLASEADGEGAGLTTGGRRRVHRVWHALGEVFGGDPAVEGVRLHWFLPTPIVYKDPEALTGFCFRDVPRPRTLEEQEAV